MKSHQMNRPKQTLPSDVDPVTLRRVEGHTLVTSEGLKALLYFLKPERLDSTTTGFQIGQEEAKSKMRNLLGKAMGKDLNRTVLDVMLAEMQ